MEVLTSRDDTGEAAEDEATLNERRLLSKYGVWLLAGNGVIRFAICAALMKNYS